MWTTTFTNGFPFGAHFSEIGSDYHELCVEESELTPRSRCTRTHAAQRIAETAGGQFRSLDAYNAIG